MGDEGHRMRITVVGGAGFIGSHLVDRMLAEGHAIDVVDDLSTGSLANLSQARSVGGDLTIHHLDATSDEFASLIGMRRPDCIFQLGLFPRAPAFRHDVRALARGFEAALVTLEAARRSGVGKVVVALPATALYGHPAAASLPIKEGDLEPRGVRGVVARAVVDSLATYRERHMIEFSALALSSVYGPRQPSGGGVVPAFLAAVDGGDDAEPAEMHGDGRQTRDLLFVDDAVDALVRSATRGSGLVINVGTGEQTPISVLWERIAGGRAAVPPRHVAPRSDELVRFAVSPVRARIHLGWSPWTDLDDGLDRTRS